MSDINITHATEKDITEIVRIFLSSNNTDKSGAHWTESSAARYIEFWHNRSKPELQLIARLENGKIAGAFFADLKPLWDGNILWDGELFVCDKYQEKGLGQVFWPTCWKMQRPIMVLHLSRHLPLHHKMGILCHGTKDKGFK